MNGEKTHQSHVVVVVPAVWAPMRAKIDNAAKKLRMALGNMLSICDVCNVMSSPEVDQMGSYIPLLRGLMMFMCCSTIRAARV